MRLPTVTATFLFTDIEGIARLWEEHPGAVGDVLARHDALLRRAIEAHAGRVFKTVGSAFCASFVSAAEALAAAGEARRSLQSVEWGEIGLATRVRMALHTGEA